jgi:hypothetical protein
MDLRLISYKWTNVCKRQIQLSSIVNFSTQFMPVSFEYKTESTIKGTWQRTEFSEVFS